jgi:hypothetical protein
MFARLSLLLIASLLLVVAVMGCTVAGAAAGAMDPSFIQSPVAMEEIANLRPGIGVAVILKDHRTHAAGGAAEGPPMVVGTFVRLDEPASTVVVVNEEGREQAIDMREIERVEKDNRLWSILGGATMGAIADLVAIIVVARDVLL